MSLGCPLPPYIKEQGGRCGRPGGGAPGGVLLPPGVGLPPFPSWNRIREKERERGRRKEGPGPPCPKPIRFGHWGACPTLPLLPSISTKAHVGPLSPRGDSGNPPYSGIYPVTPETLPMSEYDLPIYQSLCLDHLETPRHVRDHIRDTEQPSVHQNSSTHNITIIETLSVRTLRVREQCRHDRDTSPVNNQ